jgi:hypothetical protein
MAIESSAKRGVGAEETGGGYCGIRSPLSVFIVLEPLKLLDEVDLESLSANVPP